MVFPSIQQILNERAVAIMERKIARIIAFHNYFINFVNETGQFVELFYASQ